MTVATAGAAAPVIAGLVGAGGLGMTGIAATVATGVAVGTVSGAAAGGTYALTSGVLSGKDGKTILSDVGSGMLSGAASGALTGGLLGGVGSLTSKVANPVVRYATDTVGETAVDTLSDAAQGGNITPASIATSLAINAVSEGISVRSAKGAKAEVTLNKPKSGDVPVTKPRKDVTPVQQLALPGPNKSPKTNFYVVPQGNVISSQTNISDEMARKILYGQQKASNSNKVIGGHSPKINNSNPNYATQTVRTNSDGTASVDFVKQLDNGEISNIKNSTLFPQTWSDKDIIDLIKSVGEAAPLAIRTSDGSTFHRKSINGVSIDVIKRGTDVISAYPTGANLSYPGGF